MRLRQVQFQLSAVLPRLKPQMKERNLPNGQPGIVIENAAELRAALVELREMAGFADLVGNVFAHTIFSVPPSAAHVPQTDGSALEQELKRIRDAISTVLRLLEAIVPVEDPLSISIKLPEVASLADLDAVIEDLETSLDNCARRVTQEGVRLSHFDVGTNWLVLVAAGGVVLHWIRRLLDTAIRYRREEVKLLATEVHLKAINTNADLLSATRAQIETHMKQMSEALAEELRGEADASAVPHIAQAIRTLSGLYAQGIEFHRALLTTKDPNLEGEPFPGALPELKGATLKLLGQGPDASSDEGGSPNA